MASVIISAPVVFSSSVDFFYRSSLPVPIDITNTVAYKADLAVTSRLSAAADIYTSDQFKPIFSQQVHSAPASYTRNLSCWAYDLSQQLTCCSPWNSTDGALRAGTLITPRHIIYAAHYPLTTPTTIRFITIDNQIVDRTLVQAKIHPDYTPYYPDIAVGLLDSDVPGTISYCYLLPENCQEYIPTYVDPKCGALVLDQEEKALVTDLSVFTTNSVQFQAPTNTLKLSALENIITGDSGNPAFLILDNKLVLLTVHTYSTPAGTNFANQLSAINQLIQDVDTLQGVNTGYSVTTINLASYASL